MGLCPSCGEEYSGFNFCPADGTRLDEPDRCELSPLVGEVLDKRYRVIRKVGEGASAEVFEAEHIHLKKKVALKVLRKELAGTDEATERFQREAQVTSGIGHPNIVAVEDFCILEDGTLYLAMEWLEGETLDDVIDRGPLAIDDAIDIAVQTCSGLEAAHQISIVHRDLKPANLFLIDGPRGKRSSGKTVKILDFGIAKLALSQRQLTRAGMFLGTPYYVSPEQAEGKPVDPRSDIYALGVILYEMITGDVPFDGDTAIAVLRQHARDTPEPPRQRAPDAMIPPDLDRLIMRCLHKDPDRRYASAAELAEALGELEPAPSSTLPGIGLKRSDLGLGDDLSIADTLDAPAEPVPAAEAEVDLDDLVATTELDRAALDRARQRARQRAVAEGSTARLRDERPREPPSSHAALWIAGGLVAGAAAVAAALLLGVFDSGDEPAPAPTADAAAGAASPSLPTRWTIERSDGGLDYQVFVSPATIAPKQPFTLELGFEGFGDSPGKAEIKLGEQTHNLVVSRSGSASVVCELDEPGPYRVEMLVSRPGQASVTTTFDLCVGADPRDPAATASVCPPR